MRWWGQDNPWEKASEYAAANLINKQLGGYNNYNIPADKLISADGKVDASARLLYHDNWGDALFRTGLKQDYMLSMSGGSDKTTYYLSLGWLDEEGIMTRTDYQRFTARANINSQFTDWFNLEGNMGYTNDKSNQMMQAEGTYAINPFFYSRMLLRYSRFTSATSKVIIYWTVRETRFLIMERNALSTDGPTIWLH